MSRFVQPKILLALPINVYLSDEAMSREANKLAGELFHL